MFNPKEWLTGETIHAADLNRLEEGIAALPDSLELRYRRGYSPAEFGVVGDGVTDDTAAWARLIAAVPSGAEVISEPGARYKLSGPVVASKPLTLKGGTWLPHTSGRMLDITASGVSVSGIRVESGPSTPEIEHRLIHAKGTASAPLRDLTLEKITVLGTRHTGVWLEWVDGLAAHGVYVRDFQYAGIMGISLRNFHITGNVTRNGIMGGSLVNAYGIAVTDLQNSVAARSMDGHVNGNLVDNIPGWEGIDTHSGKNITFNDNVVTRCKTGIAILAGNSSRVAAPEGCTATGNVIDAMGIPQPRAGIQLLGVADGPQTYGSIGTNSIRGYGDRDVIVAYHDRARTVVAPQATDATTPGSPAGVPFRMWTALTTLTLIAELTSTTRVVTFPQGLFTSTPIVTVSKHGSGGSRFVPYVTGVSTSGCTVGLLDPSGTGGATTDVPVAVSVVQMSPTSGGGVPQI